MDFLPYISWISPKHRGKCLDYTELGEYENEEIDDIFSFGRLSESSQTFMPIDSLMSLDCVETVQCDYGDDSEDDDMGFGLLDSYDAKEECLMALPYSPTVSPSHTLQLDICYFRIAFLDEATNYYFNARTV